MEPIVLVIHLILALSLVLVVLIQRSEGGGLGIGGGQGGMGSFASVKGTAGFLTKLTWYLAIGFVATSLTLAIMSGAHKGQEGILKFEEKQVTTPELPVVEEDSGTPTVPLSVPVSE